MKQHKSQLDHSHLDLHIPHPTHKPQATPTFPSLLFNFILTILFPLLSLQIIYYFLELLLVSTEGDLWSEIFGSKVVALCYNLVQIVFLQNQNM